LAQDQADAAAVAGVAEQVVHRGQVKVHLAGVLRLERAALEVNDHEAAQAEVVEQQVQGKVLTADFQVILLADKRAPDTQLQEELAEVLDQPLLHHGLLGGVGQGEEVERVGVLEDLTGQVRLRRREGALEVGDGLALTAIQAALDLKLQNIAAPAVLDG